MAAPWQNSAWVFCRSISCIYEHVNAQGWQQCEVSWLAAPWQRSAWPLDHLWPAWSECKSLHIPACSIKADFWLCSCLNAGQLAALMTQVQYCLMPYSLMHKQTRSFVCASVDRTNVMHGYAWLQSAFSLPTVRKVTNQFTALNKVTNPLLRLHGPSVRLQYFDAVLTVGVMAFSIRQQSKWEPSTVFWLQWYFWAFQKQCVDNFLDNCTSYIQISQYTGSCTGLRWHTHLQWSSA